MENKEEQYQGIVASLLGFASAMVYIAGERCSKKNYETLDGFYKRASEIMGVKIDNNTDKISAILNNEDPE